MFLACASGWSNQRFYLIIVEHFAALAGSHRTPSSKGNRTTDESDTPVAEDDVHAARMTAAGVVLILPARVDDARAILRWFREATAAGLDQVDTTRVRRVKRCEAAARSPPRQASRITSSALENFGSENRIAHSIGNTPDRLAVH